MSAFYILNAYIHKVNIFKMTVLLSIPEVDNVIPKQNATYNIVEVSICYVLFFVHVSFLPVD